MISLDDFYRMKKKYEKKNLFLTTKIQKKIGPSENVAHVAWYRLQLAQKNNIYRSCFLGFQPRRLNNVLTTFNQYQSIVKLKIKRLKKNNKKKIR